MKQGWIAVLLLGAAGVAAKSQTVDTTVCEVLAKPASFDGKIVRIKGTVITGMDEFAIRDKTCGATVNGIWLEYPSGSKGKAGPLMTMQLQPAKNGGKGSTAPAAVKLEKNKDWKQFDSALSASVKNAASCAGCAKYTATATLVGRLDSVDKVGVSHDGAKVLSISGYGSMNVYSARLVLMSVSDVTTQEIDYTKSPLASAGVEAKGESGDPISGAQAVAKAFPAGSPPQKLLARAVEAFGVQGDDNGVSIGFGTANETHGWTEQSSSKSPDGAIYNCDLDADRLKGDTMSRAIAFTGTAVADLRDPATRDESPLQIEQRAWFATVLNAIATRQKILVAPGGYIVWDATWPNAEQVPNINKAIQAYLTEWSVYAK